MILIYVLIAIAVLLFIHQLLGKPIPFLRWSLIRMMLGMKKLEKDWQVGDGREEACAKYVLSRAKAGDIRDAIRAIDEYAYKKRFLINVGDEKGLILDRVIQRMQPRRVMELGAYVGYSALRIASMLPEGGRLYSIEFSAANAKIARRIIDHAGASNQVTVIEGYLADGGATISVLRNHHGFAPNCLDVLFLDHAKDHYLSDLRTILQEQWLHPGSIVVADNVRFPGAPDYKAYMEQEEGKTWKTISHDTHAEYQSLIPDIVLESTLVTPPLSETE
jgi:predicted O-methyltransferase YrrM